MLPIAQTAIPPDLLDRLLGPDGVAVLGIIAAVWLFREWRLSMKREIDSRDVRIADLQKERDLALEGWRAQTAATNRVADTLEEDHRDRSERRRLSDRSP